MLPCFSPDGKVLAVHDVNPTIDLHDARTGERLRSLKGHQPKPDAFYQVTGVAFTPDGRALASAGGDGPSELFRCWSSRTSKACRS